MSGFLRSQPERALRALLVTGAAGAPLLTLSLLRGRATWQQPRLVLVALACAALLLVRGELSPALADGEPARRAARYSLLVPGLLLAVACVFPVYLSWPALWLLALVQVYLLAFAHVPVVRAISLLTSGALALGVTLLHEPSAWLLVPCGAAVLLVSALDRLLLVRLTLASRVRPQIGPSLALLALPLGLGAAAYAATWALLPPTPNDYSEVGLLTPVAKAVAPLVPPSLPWRELLLLCALVVGFLLFLGAYGGGGGEGDEEQLEAPAELGWLGSYARPPIEVEAATWPAGPRRALVETYLQHLRQLDLHLARGPGETPLGLVARLPEVVRARARRLAERFGRARWAPLPLDPEDARAAAEDAAAIERAVEACEDGAHG
ncbi:MAG: hypothetical protein AB7N76_14125 [Planctomycetota bacterium]